MRPKAMIFGNVRLDGARECDAASARLGVIIWNKKSQGCGYGTAAVNALCHYAFTALGVSKVYANVRVANDRGRAYYARLGFVEEKILPNWYVQEGKSSDMVHMGILKQEWQDRQNREDR
jgi:RimJ/RimL family protein N-acetyltransferase